MEASSKARWLFAAILILQLLSYIGTEEFISAYLWPIEGETLPSLDVMTKSLKFTTGFKTLVFLVLSVVLSPYLWRLGIGAISMSRYPPPGTLVVIRTRVMTGRFAQIQGWAALLLAVLVWIPVAFFAYLYALA